MDDDAYLALNDRLSKQLKTIRLYAWLIDAGHLSEHGREWLRKPEPAPEPPKSLWDVLGLTAEQRREAEDNFTAEMDRIRESERQAYIKTRDVIL